MLGKGSVSHNTRRFHAANVDPERIALNRSYCDEDIRQVYKEMFDEAVERYNEKQTRSDRCIKNYYEKIRSGKQEKLFHEIILQVGNHENMSAKSEDGKLAEKVLDEYMKGFQERNPNMRVFSAHLHMDEATPHLHIDFVPFTTGSKRGLETRVSLKQALAAQGFIGGSRGDTEWNQWVKSEKEQLSKVMERHGIEWEQLGTHHEHLSVLDYKKKQRTKEVAALDEKISEKDVERKNVERKLDESLSKLEKAQTKLKTIKEKEKFVEKHAGCYDDDPAYSLAEPKPLMSAKAYHEKVAAPLVRKLKNVIRSILVRVFEQVRDLQAKLERANSQIDGLVNSLEKYRGECEQLREMSRDYRRLRRGLGEDRVDEIIGVVKERESAERKKVIRREHVR